LNKSLILPDIFSTLPEFCNEWQKLSNTVLADNLSVCLKEQKEVKKENFKIDEKHRPQSLTETLGQENIETNLDLLIDGVRNRNRTFGHVLLCSPPGLGKTTLANIIAYEMGVNFKSISAMNIARPGDLAALLTNLEPEDVLHIEDLHCLSPYVEEILYPAMKDFQLDIIIGQGPSARSIKLDLPPFTLVGCTTSKDLLSSSLHSCFECCFQLEYLSDQEITNIISCSSRDLGLKADQEAVIELCRISYGIPLVANYLLGMMHNLPKAENSDIVTAHLVKSKLELLQIVKIDMESKKRHVETKDALTDMSAENAGIDLDYTEAAKQCRKAAEQGNAASQNSLGVRFTKGDGVPKDDLEAAKWYRKAAEQGNATAQYNLATRYEIGKGVDLNYFMAVKWFHKAAEQGYAEAQGKLGVMYYFGKGVDKDYFEAVKWLRKAAEQGDANAQSNLGIMLSNGEGVDQDYIEALKWYRKAAEQGDAAAQYYLGMGYFKGYEGLEENKIAAFSWFNKSAELGNAKAMFRLGICYEDAYGVRKNMTKAMYWFRKSADLGNEKALEKLGEL
jgi:uncharacterized protein